MIKTSLTPKLPVSTMSGLNEDRLYLSLRTTAFSQILACEDLVPTVGPDGSNALFTLIDSLCMAIACEVVREINNYSNLQSLARDAGPAGAGIIAGFVK